ncbi:MAG: YHYH protein [Gammaproteobacteria bacterium]
MHRTIIYYALLGSLIMAAGCGSGSSGVSSTPVVDVDTSPTVEAGSDQTVVSGSVVNLDGIVTDDGTTTVTWTQISGDTVTLSDAMSASLSFAAPTTTDTLELVFELTADDGVNAAVTDTLTITVVESIVMSDAFAWFGQNVTVALDGAEVVLEATGRPDHTSCYWDPINSSGLYVDCDPDITTESRKSPGFIEEYNNLFTLRVPVNPTIAATSTATGLGAVGIAVSGAPIFNDEEGPNIALNTGVISGFDRNGAHTGPQTYHYHLEPRAITNDDDALVGIIADGFFLYGRRCFSSGTYPDDLDDSGGHVSMTQHTGAADGDEEYHYHIKNEFYLGAYYLLFPEDYQGTPNTIGN